MTKVFYCVVALVWLCSCSSNNTTADLQRIYGQQMVLPKDGQWKVLHRDTTCVVSVSRPKIMVYYNAQGCTSCRLKELMEWNKFIDEIQSLPPDSSNVDFLFVFATGKDVQNLTFSLRQYSFNHPVLCDTQKEFEAMNLLPENENFHYFLLDAAGKVCLVGSPLNNPAMWQLYKERIAKMNNELTNVF